MKKSFIYKSVLLSVLSILAACSTDDLQQPVESYSQTWTVTGEAGLNRGDNTRSISIGGTNGYTAYNIWDNNTPIVVKRKSDGSTVGQLSVAISNLNPSLATIEGEIEGTFAEGEELLYYAPSTSYNFSGQKGTLADISSNFNYLRATATVNKVDAENHILTMGFAAFDWAFALAIFEFQDQAGNPLNPEQVVIHATHDQLVNQGGEEPLYGDLTIDVDRTTIDGDRYPFNRSKVFVAFQNDYTSSADTYTFGIFANGIAYVSDENDAASMWTPSNGYSDGQYFTRPIIKLHSGTTPTISILHEKTMIVGDHYKRMPTVMIGNLDITNRCAISYSSNNTAVASVQDGVVTAHTTGTATITASTTIYGTELNESYVVEVIPAPEDVDLGLSVNWATMNVGARTETGYGTYFGWGETDGYTNDEDYEKHEYYWYTYKHHDKRGANSPSKSLTKYVTRESAGLWGYNGFYDNLTTLQAADDAAAVNWGGSWRMPTQAEIEELIANTTREPRTNYNGSGVNGVLFTSTVSGYTDKSIFIPYSGFRGSQYTQGVGQYAICWSSTLLNPYPYNMSNQAFELYFNSSTAESSYFNTRQNGYTVRAVRPKN